MRVHIGSDHAGFELKTALLDWLSSHGHEPVDHGPEAYDPLDDYPPFCLRTGEAVAADPESLGVVIGGSGNGEQMTANKVAGVRAALAWNEETARLAREHNDARVVSVGSRMHTTDEALRLVEVFLSTAFSAEPRHLRRLEMLAQYERTGIVPATP
ncbi:MAG: ribose-5-phosphate isomerase [Actinomycetota bacterium]|nr:ribose-5-phosphate isomerase [Actinomycetota bacterium]